MSPPTSVTSPDASGKRGVQAGSVYGATRISPFSSFDPSSFRTTRARPSTTPAEAALPASAPSGTAAPAFPVTTSPSLVLARGRPSPPPRPHPPPGGGETGGAPPAGSKGAPGFPGAKTKSPLPRTEGAPPRRAPPLPQESPASRGRGPGRCSTWGVHGVRSGNGRR